jgi:ribosomal protein L7/L12
MAKINATPIQFAGSFFMDEALPCPSIKKGSAEAEAMRNGEKIKATKLFRRSTGAGLAESKEFVEGPQRRAGLA